MKKCFILSTFIFSVVLSLRLSSSSSFASTLSDFGLKEGDLISAIFSDDPDVYIINEQGYKRLFLNPEIFKFYTHLGGFANVKLVTSEIRDAFPTSGLFRDCESKDPKVYGVDIGGEDSGKLHWINTTGDQAVKDDPNFFKKVFCINNKEFNWYPKSNTLDTVKDVPNYERASVNVAVPVEVVTASSSLKEIGQVIICHHTSDNPLKLETLTIGAPAVKAHLIHGDTVGECLGIILLPNSSPTPTPTSSTPIPTIIITPTPTFISPTSICVGGDGQVRGLPICLMPENLTGTAWNEVDNATGKVLNTSVCSIAVCGRNGEWRKLRYANDTYYQNGYPSNSTYIQTPFNVAYGGQYYTNGVWEINNDGIVQPGSSQISYPTLTPTPSITASPSPTASLSYSPTPTPVSTPAPSSTSGSTPTSTPIPIPTSTLTITPTPAPVLTPTPTLAASSCISDTDRGPNYGLKGSVTFTSGTYYDQYGGGNITTSGGTLYDTCVDSNVIGASVNLKEVYCDGDSRIGSDPAWPGNAFINVGYTYCTYGCNDGACNSAPTATILRNLTIGSRGDDVRKLQALLVNEVNYSTHLITGYFGQITKDAVKKLQEKYGIRPVSGYFGAITRRALSALVSN